MHIRALDLPPCSDALKFDAAPTPCRQPPLVSLFSSTSSGPLLLATSATAPNTPQSYISLLEDSPDGKETLVAWQPQDLATCVASLAHQRQLPAEPAGSATLKDLSEVLHLQAPDTQTTSVKRSKGRLSSPASNAISETLKF